MFPQCLTALLGLMVATLVALATRAAPDAGRVSGASLASALDPESGAPASERVGKRLDLRSFFGAAAPRPQAENAPDPEGEPRPLTGDANLASTGARLAVGRELLTRALLNAPLAAVTRRAFLAPASARAPPRA